MVKLHVFFICRVHGRTGHLERANNSAASLSVVHGRTGHLENHWLDLLVYDCVHGRTGRLETQRSECL